ncbi:hypothetical protein ACFLSA_01875 [Bacteroidota bacterium]
MKYSIFIFVLGFLSLGAMSNPHMATKQQIGMFKNSTLCVVLEDGSIAYNVFIKEAVEKYWKSTDFVFISQQEFNQRHFNSKYSFLVLMKGVFDNDPGGISYNYLNLVLGDESTDLTNMPELCSFPVSYSDDNTMDFGYVIPAMVKFMQKHALNLETKRFMISLRGLKYYNGSSNFKDKVLLLNKNVMALNADTPEKIKTKYPYYVKLLSPDEIQKEIASDPANALFNFHVGPAQENGAGKCFEMIFDVYGNLYYYNSRKITNENKDGFNLNDFRRL